MFKLNTLKLAMLAASVGATSVATAAGLTDVQKKDSWYQDGQALIEKISNNPADKTAKAKNIILFVGDGMGISTQTAARILQGQQAGNTGEENYLSFETFPHSGLVKTYNTNQQTPDSAGTMTAMTTGVKTKAGVINIAPDSDRADCKTAKGYELTTIMELAEKKGLSTGVVSTARITHATPAATYAKSPERNWEDDRGEACGDIAKQLVEFKVGNGIDVALGGGRRHFLPKSEGGKRNADNLIKAWSAKPNTHYVANATELNAFNPASGDRLLGLFSSSHMAYEADRSETEQPSLSQMTNKALDILSQNNKGFVLVVESGRIDHAHHAGNAYRALTDTIEYSNAVKAASEHPAVKADDTLIIVTADHSHVFTMAGYPTRGNPILGKVISNDSSGAPQDSYAMAKDDMPYTTLGYMNGRGFADLSKGGDVRYGLPIDAGRKDLSNVNTESQGYHQEALIPLSSETHAGEDITVHAKGPGAYLLRGSIEQNLIYHVINEAADLGGKRYK